MNTRSALWTSAALVLAAVLVLPGVVQAEDWKLWKHHAAIEETEPEVPNIAVQGRSLTSIESRVVESPRKVRTAATRPQNWLLHVLRIIRSINIGGLAR